MLTDRSFEILEAAIREFIVSGEPVSSSLLYRRHNFGIRPAMIRAELGELADRGYLEQPYHSAGRVPSNRGYEFFAERVLARERAAARVEEVAVLLRRGELDDLLGYLSSHLGIASVVGEAKGNVRKEGLEALMEHLPWGSRDAMMSVIKDFEALDRRIEEARDIFENKDFLEVFIGRKSPVTRSDDLAVIAGDYNMDGNRVVIFAIGPKRMNYEKAAAIFKALKHSKKPWKKN
jgi:transcriptional regulator of heat shock response